MRFSGNDRPAAKMPAGKTEHIFWDDELPGFGLRLRDGGRRSWILQYRVGRKQRRLTLGDDALSPKQAKKAAKDARAKIQLGADPQAEKEASRHEATQSFAAVLELYLEARRPELKPRTYVGVRHHLKTLFKALHTRPLREIERAEIALELARIKKGSGPIASNRARGSLSAMYAWAMGEGLADENPVLATNRAQESSRDRVLSDAELAAIWLGSPETDYGRIVRLLMLTGQRREEIAGLRISEIATSGEDPQIELPGTRTKNKRPHVVPLPAAAVSIIEGIPQRVGRDCLFGEGDGGFSGWSRAKKALDAKVKLKDEWTLHDLRRTAATRMADLGVQPHVIEAVLNHVSGHRAGVAGIYNRSVYSKEKRAALDLWAQHIELILARASGANVVSLQVSA